MGVLKETLVFVVETWQECLKTVIMSNTLEASTLETPSNNNIVGPHFV